MLKRYVVHCARCGAVLAVTDEPPTREDLSRLDRHERGHREEAVDAEMIGRAA